MHRSKKKRNIIIFSLIGILMCMTIVYAAFQTKLEVKGTSKVTSNWDIEITNVTNGTPVGSGENAQTLIGQILQLMNGQTLI